MIGRRQAAENSLGSLQFDSVVMGCFTMWMHWGGGALREFHHCTNITEGTCSKVITMASLGKVTSQGHHGPVVPG